MQGEGGAGLVHGLNVSFTHREGGWGGGVGVEWWWGGVGVKVCVLDGANKRPPHPPITHLLASSAWPVACSCAGMPVGRAPSLVRGWEGVGGGGVEGRCCRK